MAWTPPATTSWSTEALLREALEVEADLRWLDPEGHTRVFREVRAHVQGRLRSSRGREQQHAISDAKYLFRRRPGVLSPVDWDAWGQQYPEPPRPGDPEAILELTRASTQDIAADPVASAAWDYARRQAPHRPTEAAPAAAAAAAGPLPARVRRRGPPGPA